MATIPTPEQGKPILDFSAGTFDGSSNLIQSRNGATEHVNGDDVAEYVNTSRIYNTLETESKTPVGAINEVNRKGIGDIDDVNLSSPADGDVLSYDSTSSKWVNSGLAEEIDRGGVQLTQAQYDALVNAGTVDANTTYFITDGQNITTASAVTYDNTNSGIDATDVQGAIDEVNGDFVDNVCKGRTTARFTEITSSSVIKITRTASLQTYLVIVRGTNSQSYYVGLITGYGGGTPRNAIVELRKGNHIGTVSFLTSDADDFTLSITMASSSISASLNVLVIPYQQDDTFTITKT